jgi:hypothetical protein
MFTSKKCKYLYSTTSMGSITILVADIFHITILASVDPAVVATDYQAALMKVVSQLTTGNAASMTNTFWAAIVEPCKMIAGVGVLFWLVPIIPDLSFDNLKKHLLRILMLFLLTLLFAGNAYGARMFAVSNYALIKAIDTSIAAGTKLVIDANAEVASVAQNNEQVQAISNQILVCVKLPQTIADPDPAKVGNVIPNPAYIQCTKDVKTMVVAAKLSVTDPELVLQLADTEAKMNSLVDSYDYNSAWNQFVKFVKNPSKFIAEGLLGTVLDAWAVIVGQTTDEGFILSIIALPLPLAFSFMNTRPLEIWFASLWGLGIFKFSLTFLGAIVNFISANSTGNEPIYGFQLSLALGAPILAGVVAAGGGAGINSLMAQAGAEMMGAMKGEVVK